MKCFQPDISLIKKINNSAGRRLEQEFSVTIKTFFIVCIHQFSIKQSVHDGCWWIKDFFRLTFSWLLICAWLDFCIIWIVFDLCWSLSLSHCFHPVTNRFRGKEVNQKNPRIFHECVGNWDEARVRGIHKSRGKPGESDEVFLEKGRGRSESGGGGLGSQRLRFHHRGGNCSEGKPKRITDSWNQVMQSASR